MEDSADPDQMKPSDLDLHCFSRIYKGSGFNRTGVERKISIGPVKPII